MRKKSADTVIVTAEEAETVWCAWMTPERMAWLDSLTDEDIAAQIASNPDAAPELTEEWFENARLVIPLKGRKVA
jgi:hypothetical protein